MDTPNVSNGGPSLSVLYQMLTKAPMIIFAIDSSGKVTLSEGQGLIALGQVPGQTVGQSIYDLYKGLPELEKIREALANGLPMEMVVQLGEKWFKTLLIPFGDQAHKVSGAVGVAFEVTQEVKARHEAESARQLYQTLFDSVPVGLGIADLEGNLLFFNSGIIIPGGYTKEDIKRLGNVARLYFDPKEREVALGQAKAQGRLDRFEVKFKKRSGGFYFALMSLRPIRYMGSPCWLAVVEDISERKKSDEAIKRQNEELLKLNQLLVGRELKMKELKAQLESLSGKPNA